MGRLDHEEALEASKVLRRLARFDPHVAGTPPLGLNLPDSDIDVICHAPDLAAFAEHLWAEFAGHDRFSLRQWTRGPRAVIATFRACGWDFELFGAPEPVARQAGWRHFVVERRLLALGGEPLRRKVLTLRRDGLKTEPAFATALGLSGDPYDALLGLENLRDYALVALLETV